MIKAQHNLIGKLFWRNYFLWIMNRHFDKVILINEGGDVDLSKGMLVYGNHFSWWDGFIYHYLDHTYWKKKFHIMMLDEKLKENPFLSYEGAYSIDPKTKDIIQSYQYTKDLLKDKNNLVCILPQGKIESQHTNEIHIEKSMFRLPLEEGNDFNTYFSVALIDYLDKSKPTLYVYIKSVDYNSINEGVELFGYFYHQCKTKQSQLSV